jgi:hypothetical protein
MIPWIIPAIDLISAYLVVEFYALIVFYAGDRLKAFSL